MNILTHRWPIMIGLLAAFFLSITGWSIHRARTDVSGIDPVYLQKQSATADTDPLRAARR
jgi:hypothetical protein